MKRKRIKNKYYVNPVAVLDLHGFTPHLFLKKVRGLQKKKPQRLFLIF
jgi:hypothetical protein